MSIILRKVGPCTCEGICEGNCEAKIVLQIPDIPDTKKMDLKDVLKHIYCINLPESSERRKAMLKMLKTIKNTDTGKYLSIIFLKAISPHDKFYKNIRSDYNKVDNDYIPRCYCNPPDDILCKRHPARTLREVEIAISISHLQAYQRLLKNEDRLALVCEDDVILLPNIINILSEVLEPIKEELLSDKPVIVFCGGSKNNNNLSISDPSKFKLKSSKNGVYSNYAYILNHAAAQILKQKAFPINRPDDSYKRYLIVKKKITSYQIVPSIVAELSSGINGPSVYNRLSKETSLTELEHSIKSETRRNEDKIPQPCVNSPMLLENVTKVLSKRDEIVEIKIEIKKK